MSTCSFSIPFSGSVFEILNKAKSTVNNQGGSFEGDETSGSFNISVFGNTIKGTYSVAGQNLNININDKPFLIPCNSIESFLKGKIS